MIGPVLRSALAGQVPPDQLDTIATLVDDAVSRLSPVQMIGVMGELMAIQSLMGTDQIAAALARSVALAERYDMHDLLAYISGLHDGSALNPA